MTSYAKKREKMLYYQVIKEFLSDLQGDVLIDVGNQGTDTILWGNFDRRIAVNLTPLEKREGVENITGDWSTVPLPVERADVVTCLQVLEHLTTPQLSSFVNRLFEVGEIVIISVPYMWAKGACKEHRQDPINEEKLEKMVGRKAGFSLIVKEPEGPSRLITAYTQEDTK